MYCVVKVSGALQVGDVVAWNQNSFALASTLSSPLGVLTEAAYLDEDSQQYYAAVTFAGVCWARCSRDIPEEGGELMVENGRVYVDNSADGAGIVAPLPKGQQTRVAGDLVMIHVR